MASLAARAAIPALRYGPRTATALRYRLAHVKAGAVLNELFHQGWDNRKKMKRWVKKKFGRRRRVSRASNPRPTKRSRLNSNRGRAKTQLGDSLRERIACKKNLVLISDGFLIKNDMTQNIINLATFVSRDPDGTINARQRDAIDWRGCAWNAMYVNTTDEILFVNVAFVIPKTQDTPTTGDWFMNNGQTSIDTRHRDMVLTLPAFEMHNMAINKDEYDVVKHYRFSLGPKSNASGVHPDRPNWKHFRKFIPVRRKMTFENKAVVQPNNGRMFYVMWCVRASKTTTDITPANTLLEQHQFINYWRDML